MKIMASGPITSWEIDGETVETVSDFIFFGGGPPKSLQLVIAAMKLKDASVQFNHSVVSNSLRPHESQHARPPCPSPTPGVHSDSRPSSQ